MLQKLLDNGTVDHFDRDAIELQPGQDVVHGPRMMRQAAFRHSCTAELAMNSRMTPMKLTREIGTENWHRELVVMLSTTLDVLPVIAKRGGRPGTI